MGDEEISNFGTTIQGWTVLNGDSSLWSATDNGFKIPAGVSKVRVSANVLSSDLLHISIICNTVLTAIVSNDFHTNLNTVILEVQENDIIFLEASTYDTVTVHSSSATALPTWFSLEVVE